MRYLSSPDVFFGFSGILLSVMENRMEREIVKDLKISEIIEMQRKLQKKYEGKWAALTPSQGRNSLLWMIEELGEVVSIIKKRGEGAIMNDENVREAFVEELSDMMMYFHDALICYDITPEEISEAFVKKHQKNMERDFIKEHNNYLKDEIQTKLFG